MVEIKNEQINKILKIAAIVLAIIGAIIAAKQLGITQFINNTLQNILQWIDGLGNWGSIIFIAIYIIAAILLISGAILTLGAGVIFGVVKGSIVVSIASILGATAAFLIGRYLARKWVAKQIENKPKFKAIDTAVAKEGWQIVGLTRLSPVFPYVFLNYAFGITQVSLKDYFFASWIGMMPGTIMYVYIGSLAKDLATLGAGNRETTAIQWVIRVVGFIATVAVTVYVTKVAKKALNTQIENENKINSSSGEEEKQSN